MKIVDTTKAMDYAMLCDYLRKMKEQYSFFNYFSIGKSLCGRELWVIKLGDGENHLFCNGAHHSLEWITSLMLAAFAEDFCEHYEQKQIFNGYDLNWISRHSTLFLLPMVNPDGVDLVLNGLDPSNPFYDRLYKQNGGSKVFSTWQSNARGVDLNHNYAAGWSEGKMMERHYGIFGGGPTRYGGEYPESEPETSAICAFVRMFEIHLAIAFHSQGEEIYWRYGNNTPAISRIIVKKFSELTGYIAADPDGIAAYGGFKDWFIEAFGRPGFTIEVGRGTNPLPVSSFEQIYSKGAKFILCGALF